MKKFKSFRNVLTVVLCLCMMAGLCTNAFAQAVETISISTIGSVGFAGNSSHIEYTPNNVWGYSEGNCTHNYVEDYGYYYAFVNSDSDMNSLYVYEDRLAGNDSVYYNGESGAAIESNPKFESISSKAYARDIVISTGAYTETSTGYDRWDSDYVYAWRYNRDITHPTTGLAGVYALDSGEYISY